ncbi:MAG: class I SAM-dependent methyltransferase [Pseudomonadota bacterium]
MTVKPNEQYNVASAQSLPVKIAGYQRRRMFERFMKAAGVSESDTVLDIGVTSERTYASSNYFEKWFPHKANVTAAGLDDARFLEQEYPGMRFVEADGRDLPFEDNSFDFVHSSAVIEHVGSFEQQVKFVSECTRVARKGVFVTTPNRWFPVEFHTVAPLVHWLPPSMFRAIMRRTGRAFFASEDNLNLMSSNTLMQAAQAAGATRKFKTRVDSVRLGGWPSNLLLVGTAA